MKTAKGRKLSSTRWLERQLNDPYVQRARADGYRSRAAYKLMELDDKFRFLLPGKRVVDLGCAPGGWCQVAADRTNASGASRNKPQGLVLGIDLLEVEALPGVIFHQIDFLSDDANEQLKTWLSGPADAVLSDMAPKASGHPKTDHLRIMALCDAAAELACQILNPGGVFVSKVLAGGAEAQVLSRLKQAFAKVVHVKPPASRADSSEKYLVAIGYRG